MSIKNLSRRSFLERSAMAAGAVALTPGAFSRASAAAKRTAVDQVTLGNTGINLSRLGLGTGTGGGSVQLSMGRKGFNKLVRHAYDHGITYFDCAAAYSTFDWIAGAIKGLPREKLFIQSKVQSNTSQVLQEIDRQRKVLDTDYIDSLLIHCVISGGWTDGCKRVMDGFDEAKEKKWIRAKGVSCHSLPALRAATTSDWIEVQLVRINPQGNHIDGEEEVVWHEVDHQVQPVMAELQRMHAKGRGVIGMKIMGNGTFVKAEDREKSILFAMACPELDAIVIGFKCTCEIDEAIKLMNAALAA
jgi:predicted aldo/keto reductase-like oxidoreductase